MRLFWFIWRWLFLAALGGSAVWQVTKVMTGVLLFVIVIEEKSKVRLSIIRPEGGEMGLPWDLSFSIAVVVLVAVIWLAAAFGMSWEKYGSLDISEDSMSATNEYFRVRVDNTCNADVLPSATIDRIEGDMASDQELISSLPIELCWKNYPIAAEMPKIPAGEYRFVDVAKISTIQMIDPATRVVCGTVTIPGEKVEHIIAVYGRGTTWFRLTVRGITPICRRISRWLSASIVPVNDGSGNAIFVVEYGSPPRQRLNFRDKVASLASMPCAVFHEVFERCHRTVKNNSSK